MLASAKACGHGRVNSAVLHRLCVSGEEVGVTESGFLGIRADGVPQACYKRGPRPGRDDAGHCHNRTARLSNHALPSRRSFSVAPSRLSNFALAWRLAWRVARMSASRISMIDACPAVYELHEYPRQSTVTTTHICIVLCLFCVRIYYHFPPNITPPQHHQRRNTCQLVCSIPQPRNR